jgi:preprotein translocase subunit YajC
MDNQSQQRDFPKLKSLVEKKYVFAGKWVDQKKRGIAPSYLEMLRGKQVMDSIRVVVGNMGKREESLMQSRKQRNSQVETYTPIGIFIGALIAVMLTLFFYFKLRRDMAKNEQLQSRLEQIEKERNHQIGIIGEMAKRVAEGDYSVRIDPDKLRRND